MKIGFDKAKVTCFKCKQKWHFKRECTNQQADDIVNQFHEDYYKKAIYHRNNEQQSRTNQKQIGEGSLNERKQALIINKEDEGFNWNKYILKEKLALVAKIRPSREGIMRGSVFVDPQGNPAVDPKMVDFEALVAAIPTAGVWESKILKDLNYNTKLRRALEGRSMPVWRRRKQ
ncbi:putative transcription factor interactor and regulator CCHC(Zn) family [Helianthus anomalus]